MHHRRAFERLIQRAIVIVFCFSLGFTPIAALAQDAKAPADPRVHKPITIWLRGGRRPK